MYVIHGQGIGARYFSITQRLTFEQKTTAPKVRLVPHIRKTPMLTWSARRAYGLTTMRRY